MFDHRQKFWAVGATVAMALSLGMLNACSAGKPKLDAEKLNFLANDYTAAWCSHDAAAVAKFYAPNGSLKINNGELAVGRVAIAAVVQKYMTDFPDLDLEMEELSLFGGEIVYHWTLSGKNTRPGGTGKSIRISGFEEWTVGPDGLIATSRGHYDEAEFQRQLQVGAPKLI